jgi:hypothetical protein
LTWARVVDPRILTGGEAGRVWKKIAKFRELILGSMRQVSVRAKEPSGNHERRDENVRPLVELLFTSEADPVRRRTGQ